MNLIREHYEPLLLIAVAIVLVICSIFIWQNAARFALQLRVMPPAPGLGAASLMAKAEELDRAIEKLHQAPQWTSIGQSGLFVPEKHFIGADGLPATLQT